MGWSTAFGRADPGGSSRRAWSSPGVLGGQRPRRAEQTGHNDGGDGLGGEQPGQDDQLGGRVPPAGPVVRCRDYFNVRVAARPDADSAAAIRCGAAASVAPHPVRARSPRRALGPEAAVTRPHPLLAMWPG